MKNKNNSVHLQNFPNLSFFKNDEDLVRKMDFVRAICSTTLSIRDNKNLRVRLPLNELKIIGKNAFQIEDFKEIIAEEVNVKKIILIDKIDEFAELKLKINFKKIGAKYGSKIKQITDAAKNNNWKKISENQVEIAEIILIDDEFEIQLMTINSDENKFLTMPVSGNDCLVSLDIQVTSDLINEGISRDIVRIIQQSRKSANLNVADNISVKIFSSNKSIIDAINYFSDYIKKQVLALNIEVLEDKENIKKSQFCFENSIDSGDLFLGISVKN